MPRYSRPRTWNMCRRLFAHIEYRDGHWLWTGGRRGPYGALGGEGLTHRMAFQMWVRPLAPNEEVHHRCDEKLCFNPCHLEARDATAHRRHHRALQVERGTDRWGKRHLTAADKEAMAVMAETMTYVAIAKQMGVSRWTASRIVNQRGIE
jgi:hypothetical protein